MTAQTAATPRRRFGAPHAAERPLIEPPTLAPGVELHPPASEGEPWFVRRGTHQYFKLTDDLARLADLVDGVRSRETILTELGAPWTASDVERALRSLGDAHVLRAEGERTRPRRDVLRFVPPFTVQLTLFNPSELLRRIAALTPVARTRGSVITAVAVMALGILSLVVRPSDVFAALSSPVSYPTVLAIFIGTLAATALHEFGHGLVLASYGGRPRRIGVMLFYLMPAFFCDVSDGWRLSRSRQRVHVALAGIIVQGTIGGTAALLALLPLSVDARRGLLIFAMVTLVACLMNTIPFVKLDGYIALMSWLDIPHLRDKSISDARGALASVLFGKRPERALPDLRWAVAFGFACLLFPLFLLANAFLIWFGTLQRLGVIGSVLTIGLIAMAVIGLGKEIGKTVGAAHTAGASRTRIGIVSAVGVAALASALALVPVPQSVAGGFIHSPGESRLVLPTSADAGQIAAGMPVELRTSGIVLSVPIGTAAVGEGAPVDRMQPFSSLFPVRDEAPLIPTTTLALTDVVVDDDVTRGAAFIRLESLPLWRWLLTRLTDAF